MNRDALLPGLIGVLVGILLMWLFAPWWGGMTSPMFTKGFFGSSRGATDAWFIEQMIPHHEDAILMAKLAPEKSAHQEIKQLAQDIERVQSAEIEQMRAWYRAWFGTDVPNVDTGHGMAMHMGMMGDTDIDSLKTAAEFDKEFIEQMIPHHHMAVMMAQMLLQATERPEMRELAQNIISSQTREINSMRTWYREWYSR